MKTNAKMPPTVPAIIGVFDVVCDFALVSPTMMDVSEGELWYVAEALDTCVEIAGEGRGAAVLTTVLTTEDT